ncbi:unnamed protein product [Parajaminaea phylloscopi]
MLATMQTTVPSQHPHHLASSSRASRQATSTSNTSTSKARAPKASKPAMVNAPPKRAGLRSGTAHSSSRNTPQPNETSFNVSASSTPGLLTLSRPTNDGEQPAAASAKSSSRGRKAPRSVTIQGNDSGNDTDGQGIHAPDPSAKARNTSVRAQPKGTQADAGSLSQSAPASSIRSSHKALTSEETGQHDWEMPAATSGSREVLNWQQQLTATSKPKKAKKQPKQTAQPRPTSDSPADALTWQQELLNPTSTARRGPHFDVFADAKDAETFGGSGDELAHRSAGRQRAGSVGEQSKRAAKPAKGKKGSRANALAQSVGDLSIDDIFGNAKASTAASGGSGPSTPAKRPPGKGSSQSSSSPLIKVSSVPALGIPNGSTEAAYAGPDFHNSPSAASLPAPKFGSRQGKSVVSSLQRTGSHRSGTSSSSSSGEDAEGSVSGRRNMRGATAPPAPVAATPAGGESTLQAVKPKPTAPDQDKSATIENLLARLMGGGA